MNIAIKLFKLKLVVSIIILFGFISKQSFGQELNRYSKEIKVSSKTFDTPSFLMFEKPCLNHKVKDGFVQVKFDLGKEYDKGSAVKGVKFKVKVNLDLELLIDNSSDLPSLNVDLELNNNKPESIVFLNLSKYIINNAFSSKGRNINGVRVKINSLKEIEGKLNLSNDLNITLGYDINYSEDVTNQKLKINEVDFVQGSKVVKFSWNSDCISPNFEFQVLRLFNTDKKFTQTNKIIKTSIDWSKALKFKVPSRNNSLRLTLGEGEGYYIWRVRPIGTYYEKGEANSLNWGEWSTSDFPKQSDYEFNENIDKNSYELFFFKDADNSKNYQYTRVFTENNRVSEQVTYATSLNQVKQTQKYIPSKNYKIITQTVYDRSGRPVLNTLPVPIIGKDSLISSYKNGFLNTKGLNGDLKKELYKSKHFDLDENYNNPNRVDVTGAFDYYSGNGKVPSVEQYPFTRVIYSNDGTNRITEKSGIGKKHMIGKQSQGMGRTVRTFYGTASEDELVALFGDEAPKAEQTSKIVTIDPNNTKTITYINKDGKTIATSLGFNDSDVNLDKINPKVKVAVKEEKITKNIKTPKGFLSSKRLLILKDNTEIGLSYRIRDVVLESLCNDVEVNRDFSMSIKVFDIATNDLVKDYSIDVSSINSKAEKDSDDEGLLKIDLGKIVLDKGTYYIQKSLIPTDQVKLEVKTSKKNLKEKIEPFFDWIQANLKEIDCEEEMQYFYNDLFYYSKLVYNQVLDSNDGSIKFSEAGSCLNCSGISYQFSEEFIKSYSEHRKDYVITLFYYENKELKEVDLSLSKLGTIKPVYVLFETPCCSFEIPINYSPRYRIPNSTILEKYKNDENLVTQLNNDKFNSNFNFLTDESKNFTYDKNSLEIINGEAYPVDFEGYAISMLYECKKSTSDSYTIEDAKKIFYKAMNGWNKEGLFNQMIYHMLTDSHGAKGCNGLQKTTSINHNEMTRLGETESYNTSNKYKICDIPRPNSFVGGAQYSPKKLVECWEPIVTEFVNKMCNDRIRADYGTNDRNVNNNIKKQDGGSEAIDDAVDDIDGWFFRLIARWKIKKKLKKQSVNKGFPIDSKGNENDNLVKRFLDCSGYAFADIILPSFSNKETVHNFKNIEDDFDKEIGNGEYRNDRIYLSSGIKDAKELFDDAFPRIEDVVYAYKYYTYIDGTFQDLEGITCYSDPNICYDDDKKLIPCCGGTLKDPVLCNFCGIGYIKCPYVKDAWSCDQRYTFYELLRNYKEDENDNGSGIPVNCENYYEQRIFYKNPDYMKMSDFEVKFKEGFSEGVLSSYEYISQGLVDQFVKSGVDTSNPVKLLDIKGNSKSNVSLIENQAYNLKIKCDTNCDKRRVEFRSELIKMFKERCYVIGGCKVHSDDNVVPIKDIELILDKMVAQCKKQCSLTTYSCQDEPCRSFNRSNKYTGDYPLCYDMNISTVDFGVSGPIVSGTSSKEGQYLKIYDPILGKFKSTNLKPTIKNVSESGVFERYDYQYSESPISIWNVRSSLTYSEYSRWIQAKKWLINLNIKSKCNSLGQYNSSLIDKPNQDVYVKKSRQWVIQDSLENCSSKLSEDYISRGNPNGKTDTFLEREAYIKNPKIDAESLNPLNKVVKTKKIGIKVDIEK